jgi:Family of unknown function (DUF6228)
MRTFSLSSPQGSLKLQSTYAPEPGPYESWQYQARIEAPSISAHVRVDDHLPSRFFEFFAGMARDWKGWSGEREYESLEHALKISAKHDGASSVWLTIQLRSGVSEDLWRASIEMSIELGQLPSVAKSAQEFTAVETRVAV